MQVLRNLWKKIVRLTRDFDYYCSFLQQRSLDGSRNGIMMLFKVAFKCLRSCWVLVISSDTKDKKTLAFLIDTASVNVGGPELEYTGNIQSPIPQLQQQPPTRIQERVVITLVHRVRSVVSDLNKQNSGYTNAMLEERSEEVTE